MTWLLTCLMASCGVTPRVLERLPAIPGIQTTRHLVVGDGEVPAILREPEPAGPPARPVRDAGDEPAPFFSDLAPDFELGPRWRVRLGSGIEHLEDALSGRERDIDNSDYFSGCVSLSPSFVMTPSTAIVGTVAANRTQDHNLFEAMEIPGGLWASIGLRWSF